MTIEELTAEVARLTARVAQLEEALRDIAGAEHSDLCDAMRPTRGCTCLVGDARVALGQPSDGGGEK